MRPQVLLVALAVFAVLVALPLGKGEAWTFRLISPSPEPLETTGVGRFGGLVFGCRSARGGGGRG